MRNRIAPDAVAIQRLRQVLDRALLGQAQAKVVVGGFIERAVVTADRAIHASANQAELIRHELQQHALRGIGRHAAFARPEQRTRFIHFQVLRISHAQRRPCLHECEHGRQRMRFKQVVAIQHADEVPACIHQRLRECAGIPVLAAIAEQPEPGIAAGVVGGDLAAAIGGAVVPQQAFPVWVILRQQAVQRRRQEAGGVVDGNGDADQGGHARSVPDVNGHRVLRLP